MREMGVLNIAHRGGAALYPENTLAAFRDAVARGCDGAELDVQLSKDGEVVVYHDYRLKPEITRGPDGGFLARPTPRIKDLTLAELRAFDVGRCDPASEYARAHPDVKAVDGERIPTLAEVIAVARTASKPFHLFVELKTSFADRDLSADPSQLADATVNVLRGDYLDRTDLRRLRLAGAAARQEDRAGSRVLVHDASRRAGSATACRRPKTIRRRKRRS